MGIDEHVSRRRCLYLFYRRLRAPLGIPFGFILLAGSLAGSPLLVLTAAFGFFAVELFGGFYNDYWDYDEDVRNERKDKFTTLGLLTRGHMHTIAWAIAALGMITLAFTPPVIFALGIFYLLLFIGYSHPRIKLKGWVGGYVVLASMFLLLPWALASIVSVPAIPLLSLFFFFQFLYILFQKDSTDPKDEKNIFFSGHWKRSTVLTAGCAILSSCFLFIISLTNPVTLVYWVFNASSKFLNVSRIHTHTITRWQRSKLILMEFATPYLYIGGFLG